MAQSMSELLFFSMYLAVVTVPIKYFSNNNFYARVSMNNVVELRLATYCLDQEMEYLEPRHESTDPFRCGKKKKKEGLWISFASINLKIVNTL